jgi:predicted GNAT superfamily acetyltransferase
VSEVIFAMTPADVAEPGALRDGLVALNNAHAAELSWLEPARLQMLVGQAVLALAIGDAGALLLALDQTAEYDSPNYQWFRKRFARFVYVDRVVVAEAARGRGYARQLYERVFAYAKQAGHGLVVCEVNADPPNPGSDAFHAALGFVPVGSAAIHGGSKTVRYLCYEVRCEADVSR